MLEQFHTGEVSLCLFLGDIAYWETQKIICEILVNPDRIVIRGKLFIELDIMKLVTINKYENNVRSQEEIVNDFLKRTSADFYLARMHGGFYWNEGTLRKNVPYLEIFNKKDKKLQEALKVLKEFGTWDWLLKTNERNYDRLMSYKFKREKEIKAFTKTNPEFRSLEKQIHELDAWQEAFADWFLKHGYELPKWGPEEGILEPKAETPKEKKDKTTNFIGEAENTSEAKEPSLSEKNDSNNFTRCDNGETWMITFQGKSVSFKDAKGLRYLAILLDSPGKSFTPKMLITLDSEAPDFSAESTQDEARQAGISDKDVDQGIPRFEPEELERLGCERDKLESDYQKANEKGDYEEAMKIDKKKHDIEKYILKGKNIRGQPRKITSEAEKQRISVYNAIKDQLRKFEKSIPALNTHLNTKKTLKTGSVLVYQPYPNVFWTVSF